MEDRQYYEAHAGVAQEGKEPYTAHMGANSHMIGGDHYRHGRAVGQCPSCRKPVQHWDWSFNLKGLEYAATKYIARWEEKGDPLDNLQKALHYVQKIIEIHFPWVTVSISYGNRTESPADAPAQPPETEFDLGASKSIRPEVGCGPKVDGSKSQDSDACPARDSEGTRCCLMKYHTGAHEAPWIGS